MMESISIAEVVRRAREGQRVDEKEFDMSIFAAAERLKRRFDIRYDPDNPIPADDAMADRLFEAALKFYVDVGTYLSLIHI